MWAGSEQNAVAIELAGAGQRRTSPSRKIGATHYVVPGARPFTLRAVTAAGRYIDFFFFLGFASAGLGRDLSRANSMLPPLLILSLVLVSGGIRATKIA